MEFILGMVVGVVVTPYLYGVFLTSPEEPVLLIEVRRRFINYNWRL